MINPNSDKDYLDELDISNEHNFPKFLKKIEFNPFRHIPNLSVNFKHPISIITGTNRSGKTTILMALACSHLEFKKRNIYNGNFERHTWSSLMYFTRQDIQIVDWNYFITYKIGRRDERKRGQRKASTKKWNGIGKKESQFKNRSVIFIDMDRVMPARNFGRAVFGRARYASTTSISDTSVSRIEEYVSYILEENFTLNKITQYLDKSIYKYTNTNDYSSYNAATGEEVLLKIIIDIVEAPRGSLILIDEIEVGLHPKIQRRLMQVIYNVAKQDVKQFILTSHSSSILASVPNKARIFIERSSSGQFRAIQNISINAALSKMDSISYPLIDLYCEDEVARNIILKAISSIQIVYPNFSNLINIIIAGSANDTYLCFKVHQKTFPNKKVTSGYACILDGDQRQKRNSVGDFMYPEEECLHFFYSNYSPEKFLVDEYEKGHSDPNLRYHVDQSNVHCLFEKMNEISIGTSKDEAFEICWNYFISTDEGLAYFQELEQFLLRMMRKFSPDL